MSRGKPKYTHPLNLRLEKKEYESLVVEAEALKVSVSDHARKILKKRNKE